MDPVNGPPPALTLVALHGNGGGGSLALEFVQRFSADIDGLLLHAPVGARLRSRLLPRLLRLPGVAELGRRVFASRASRCPGAAFSSTRPATPARSPPLDRSVVVRSAFSAEDRADSALAGFFETKLRVAPGAIPAALDAVRGEEGVRGWASRNSAPSTPRSCTR